MIQSPWWKFSTRGCLLLVMDMDNYDIKPPVVSGLVLTTTAPSVNGLSKGPISNSIVSTITVVVPSSAYTDSVKNVSEGMERQTVVLWYLIPSSQTILLQRLSIQSHVILLLPPRFHLYF